MERLVGGSNPEYCICGAMMSESNAELDRLDQETRRTADLIRQQLNREFVQVHVRTIDRS